MAGGSHRGAARAADGAQQRRGRQAGIANIAPRRGARSCFSALRKPRIAGSQAGDVAARRTRGDAGFASVRRPLYATLDLSAETDPSGCGGAARLALGGEASALANSSAAACRADFVRGGTRNAARLYRIRGFSRCRRARCPARYARPFGTGVGRCCRKRRESRCGDPKACLPARLRPRHARRHPCVARLEPCRSGECRTADGCVAPLCQRSTAPKTSSPKTAQFARTNGFAFRRISVAHGRQALSERIRIEKASAEVKIGDLLTLPRGREVIVVRVLGCGIRRGPASEAQALYETLTDNALDPAEPQP